MGRKGKKTPAVFIDRDGTLIHERHYLRTVKGLRLFAGAVKAMKLLKEAGFKLIMVTNQSGIGRGYLTEATLARIHAHLEKMLKKQGVSFDGVYYCPHHPDVKCSCRKPNLGMVRAAQRRFGLDLKRSYVIGDHVNDFLLAQNMKGTGIFVLTGHGKHEQEKIRKSKGVLRPDHIEKNILTAARLIIRHKDRR